MIDEKKIIEEIKRQQQAYESKAAEYDEDGNIIEMDICDAVATALKNIIRLIENQIENRIENDPKLKPCPFCSGEVELMAIAGEPYPPTYKVDINKITEESEDVCFVHCPTCNANFHKEMRIESFPLDTIKWWNKRAEEEQWQE